MNYSQWILNRHWEINTNCFVVSASTQKTAWVLLHEDFYCLPASRKLDLPQHMWLELLTETQTLRENKSLLTRGSILLGVPVLAIYLEFVNLLLVSRSVLAVKSSSHSCVTVAFLRRCWRSWSCHGAAPEPGSLRAGWQGGHARRVSSESDFITSDTVSSGCSWITWAINWWVLWCHLLFQQGLWYRPQAICHLKLFLKFEKNGVQVSLNMNTYNYFCS